MTIRIVRQKIATQLKVYGGDFEEDPFADFDALVQL